MRFINWLDTLRNRARRTRRVERKGSQRSPLQVYRQFDVAPSTEELEDRALLAAITVDTTVDEVNGTTSSITALMGNPGGAGISLREAVIAANNTAGADTINLPPGLYALTITGANENAAATGDLDIRDETVIQSTVIGVNAIVDATALGNDRVFHKNSDSAGSFTLNDITIQGGTNTGNTASSTDHHGYGGGGISVTRGDLNLNRVIVRNNTTTGSATDGAGLNVDFDETMTNYTITITDSTFDNNTSSDRGGAIYIDPDGGADLPPGMDPLFKW